MVKKKGLLDPININLSVNLREKIAKYACTRSNYMKLYYTRSPHHLIYLNI